MSGRADTMEDPLDRAELAAVRAGLPRFGIDAVAVRLLSRSENVVFGVETADGGRFAARLHRPGYNSLVELDSEVAWATALADAGVPVPRATPLVGGDGPSRHYTQVDIQATGVRAPGIQGNDTAANHTGEHRWMGVIEWVVGEPLGSPVGGELDDVAGLYRRIGELAARVRTQASGWTPPQGFTRRRWDRDAFVGPDPLWGRFWEVDGITDGQRSLFAAAREVVADRLGELSTGPDRFGLIHADLHLANVMTDGEALTIIDFDDSGYGWYPFELAVSLHPVLDHPDLVDAHAAIIDGYRSVFPLGVEEIELIDLFIVVRCLMLIGWLDARRSLPIYEHASEVAAQSELVVRHYLETGLAFAR